MPQLPPTPPVLNRPPRAKGLTVVLTGAKQVKSLPHPDTVERRQLEGNRQFCYGK